MQRFTMGSSCSRASPGRSWRTGAQPEVRYILAEAAYDCDVSAGVVMMTRWHARRPAPAGERPQRAKQLWRWMYHSDHAWPGDIEETAEMQNGLSAQFRCRPRLPLYFLKYRGRHTDRSCSACSTQQIVRILHPICTIARAAHHRASRTPACDASSSYCRFGPWARQFCRVAELKLVWWPRNVVFERFARARRGAMRGVATMSGGLELLEVHAAPDGTRKLLSSLHGDDNGGLVETVTHPAFIARKPSQSSAVISEAATTSCSWPPCMCRWRQWRPSRTAHEDVVLTTAYLPIFLPC